jgi:hypothetical protein
MSVVLDQNSTKANTLAARGTGKTRRWRQSSEALWREGTPNAKFDEQSHGCIGTKAAENSPNTACDLEHMIFLGELRCVHPRRGE